MEEVVVWAGFQIFRASHHFQLRGLLQVAVAVAHLLRC
jgi:hypothetical protein